MRAKALTLMTFALLSAGAFAQAGPKELFYSLIANGGTITENTTCVTTVEKGRVSCTLIGSHASCGRDEEYVCQEN